MADPSALYPQPPSQQQQGALTGDPLRLIGALQGIQNLRLQQQQMPALAQQPAATLQGTNINNATAQLQQQNEARRIVNGAFGTAISSMDNPTPDDIHNLTAYLARSYPQIQTTYPNMISDAAGFVLNNPGKIKESAGTLLNMGLTPGEAVSRVQGPPGPGGASTTLPVGNINIGATGAPGAARGQIATSQPPGEAELQAESAARASRLQGTAGTTAQYHADLDNLKQDSQVLGNLGGPTFDVEKKLNQLSTRVAGLGVTMTPDQLRAGESFDKIANQISLNQSQMFHGSDAGLHTVVGANPATSMSAYGRDGVIDMLQGNQDAIDRTRQMWLDAKAKGAPANSYDTFVNQVSSVLDPRVFQFNRMSRDNQQKFLSQMDPADLPDFERKYQAAITNKWVKPLKSAPVTPNAAQ